MRFTRVVLPLPLIPTRMFMSGLILSQQISFSPQRPFTEKECMVLSFGTLFMLQGNFLCFGGSWPAADLRVACGQKSGKIYIENLREYFRIVSAVSALFSQFRIRREGRAGVKRQNRIFLLAYARSDSGRGLRGMLPEAQGCQLTQRRHLAPCRKRYTIPARRRYKIFYSIQKSFFHTERELAACGLWVGCLACGQF